jgi:hypothetical protein
MREDMKENKKLTEMRMKKKRVLKMMDSLLRRTERVDEGDFIEFLKEC